MAKNFSPPLSKEKTTQKSDSDELSWLVIRNGPGGNVVGVVRLLLTNEDLEHFVPVLERLWRSENNPHFSFKVERR